MLLITRECKFPIFPSLNKQDFPLIYTSGSSLAIPSRFDVVCLFNEDDTFSTDKSVAWGSRSNWSKDDNQQQTESTYDARSGSRTRATLVGGESSHHCAIPALPDSVCRSAVLLSVPASKVLCN